jgi:hypothetical protein
MNHGESTALERRLEPLEPPYKSTEEAQIGRMLDRYGVPFFYMQERLVYESGAYRIQRPDFTLPWYNGLVINYIGDADSARHENSPEYRRQLYIENAIPAVFLGPADLTRPSWEEGLYARLQRAGEEALRSMDLYGPTRYRPVTGEA